MKSDEEIVREIMEAGGWGYSQKGGIFNRVGRALAGKAASGLTKAVGKAKNAYQDAQDFANANPTAAEQQRQHAKLRQMVLNKLNNDYANWNTRTGSQSNIEVTVTRLRQFVEDEYSYDAEPFITATRQQMGMPGPKAAQPQQAAPQAAPEPTPAAEPAPEAPEAQPEANPKTLTRKRGAPRKAAKKDDPTEKKPGDYIPNDSDAPHHDLNHYMRQYDRDQAAKDAKKPRRESIDLAKSFSQIVMEDDIEQQRQSALKVAQDFKDKFFTNMANFILRRTERGINFVRDGVISDHKPGSGTTKPVQPPGAEPAPEPVQQPEQAAQPQQPAGGVNPFVQKVEGFLKQGGVADPSGTLNAMNQRMQQAGTPARFLASLTDPKDIDLAKKVLTAMVMAANAK